MKLKSLNCPNCGNGVDVQSEEQKFVFCGQCGSKLVLDDEVQKIEYTHKGEVVHKLEGVEKLDELTAHIKTAGGGSQLSKATSIAEAGFMSLETKNPERAAERFEEAIATYSECRPALLGKALIANLDEEDLFFQILRDGKIVDSEKNLIKKHIKMADLFLRVFASAELKEHLIYTLSLLSDDEKKECINKKEVLGYDSFLELVPPLDGAVLRENTEIANILINNGADINFLGYEDESILGVVARFPKLKMVDFLLEAGADCNLPSVWIDCPDNNKNRMYVSPAQCLIAQGNIEYVKKLLECGKLDPNECIGNHINFMVAVWASNCEMVELLCQYGADPLKIYVKAQTPKLKTDNFGLKGKCITIPIINIKIQLNKTPLTGWTPLAYAMYKNNKELVKVLLKYIGQKQNSIEFKAHQKTAKMISKVLNKDIKKMICQKD